MAVDQHRRLADAEAAALAAERSSDPWAANAAWERYRLIEDALRTPDERLAAGIALSKTAIRLCSHSTTSPRS